MGWHHSQRGVTGPLLWDGSTLQRGCLPGKYYGMQQERGGGVVGCRGEAAAPARLPGGARRDLPAVPPSGPGPGPPCPPQSGPIKPAGYYGMARGWGGGVVAMVRFPWVAIMGWSRLCELLWDAGWGRAGPAAPQGSAAGGWECGDAPGTGHKPGRAAGCQLHLGSIGTLGRVPSMARLRAPACPRKQILTPT